MMLSSSSLVSSSCGFVETNYSPLPVMRTASASFNLVSLGYTPSTTS